VDSFERPHAVAGSSDTFALDTWKETGSYNLESIFVTASPPGKDDKTNCRDHFKTLARRIRVETSLTRDKQGCQLIALQMSVERKWHAESFSLDVSPIVNTVSSSRPIPSGLSIDEIHSAVAADCFEVSSARMQEDGTLRLPLGVSVQYSESSLEVAFKDKAGSERILRRDFVEGEDAPKVAVWRT